MHRIRSAPARRARRGALALALALAGALLAPAALARTYVELILDASGSMWNTLDDGRYRIVAAKEVLTGFVAGLPDGDLDVGLRVYGSRVDALDPGACEDTALLVPLEGVDEEALTSTVQGTVARGATPIVRSLRAAAQDFPDDATRRVIVLVTDGEESCGGDLEAVAEELRAEGVEIDLRIVGFDLDPAAQAAFESVGSFVNAEDAEELARALEGAVADVVEEPEPTEDACAAPATLDAPAAATAGFGLEVGFEGPVGHIGIAPAASPDDERPAGEAFSGWGSPAELRAPSEPGDYEVRYRAQAGGCIVARAPLVVEPVAATLDAPAEVQAGYPVAVAFEGPEGHIVLSAPDGAGRRDGIAEAYTGWGNPAELLAPSEPGAYEVRYYDANGAQVAARPLSVTASTATIEAPAEVEAGYVLRVDWDGPEGNLALIAPEAAERHEAVAQAYTGWGDPAELHAPGAAGEYEVRYYDANDAVIAALPVRVLPSAATLAGPGGAAPGETIAVDWSGPEGDVVLIAPEAAERHEAVAQAYTGWGDPAELTIPEDLAPGAYELRFYGGVDQAVLARAPIEIR